MAAAVGKRKLDDAVETAVAIFPEKKVKENDASGALVAAPTRIGQVLVPAVGRLTLWGEGEGGERVSGVAS